MSCMKPSFRPCPDTLRETIYNWTSNIVQIEVLCGWSIMSTTQNTSLSTRIKGGTVWKQSFAWSTFASRCTTTRGFDCRPNQVNSTWLKRLTMSDIKWRWQKRVGKWVVKIVLRTAYGVKFFSLLYFSSSHLYSFCSTSCHQLLCSPPW